MALDSRARPADEGVLNNIERRTGETGGISIVAGVQVKTK